MRTLFLFPLALATAACGTASHTPEQTAYGVSRRDLTLQEPAAPTVLVTSPVELARTPVEPSTSTAAQRARHPAKLARPRAAEPHIAPASLAPAKPAAVLAAPPRIPAVTDQPKAFDPHALAPGQTVTVIPVSSGPSPTPSWTDELPAEARGTVIHAGGGHCGPRNSGGHRGGFRLDR